PPPLAALFPYTTLFRSPGEWALARGSTYRNDGATPHWRGIFDDHGRVMVAMTFNSDVGDSWEWADDPNYPEKYSALGIRIGVNRSEEHTSELQSLAYLV